MPFGISFIWSGGVDFPDRICATTVSVSLSRISGQNGKWVTTERLDGFFGDASSARSVHVQIRVEYQNRVVGCSKWHLIIALAAVKAGRYHW